MKLIFELPILVIILALAWQPIVQAQQSDASMLESNATVDLKQLRTMAEKGDPDAQFRLGELYEEGDIVDRDLDTAIESYRKAAEQGHSGAQYALAHNYHLGSGVTQDMAAAMVWYRKAALQGDEWSQLALGDQYRIGLTVPRNLVQSTKWYRRAAERGNIFAQFELGNAYRFGNGVERDATQAMEWYRLSAEAGNPSAKLALAELENGGAAADMLSAQAPAPDVSQDPGSDALAGTWEDELASSKTVADASETDHADLLLPESDGAPKAASSAPASDAADPGAELAYATGHTYSDEEEVSFLLAHAQDQVAKLALTTPEGDNAYQTYQLILSFQPNNEAALDGIQQIGVKYVELANLAAAKGDLQKTRHYAAKATDLAPEHPLVQSMTIPTEADPPKTEETTPPPEILANFKAPLEASEEPQEVAAKVQVATATSASATPEDLIENANDLVFKPYDYQGRQLAVAGPVVHLFWDYRLVAETGQNSIVIDLDGLSQADRDKLDAAIDKAGFLGQVHARIKGTIERQGLASFELVATELALTGFAIGKDEASGADLGTDIDEVGPLVVPVYSGEPFGQTNAFNNGTRSGDRGRASASAGNSNGGGSGGGSSDGGNADGGNADGGNADGGNGKGGKGKGGKGKGDKGKGGKGGNKK